MSTRHPPPDPEDHLTAEETAAIQAMLEESVPERTQIISPAFSGTASGGDPIVLRFDLVAGSGRKADNLPGLQLIHERFANELGGEFRRAVGTEGHFIAERARFAKFAEIYARLPAPTAVAVANFAGIGGQVVITMEPEVMLHFLDLLMGGEGGLVTLRSDLASRGFTAAERGLVSHVTAIFSRALATAWSEITKVHLDLVRVASDPRHASIFEPSETMADLALRVEWGDVRGTMHFVFPQAFLGPFEDILAQPAGSARPKNEPVSQDVMRQNLEPVSVDISVLLGTCELTLAKLLALAPGDVLRLAADPDEPVALFVEGIEKLVGFPTVQHGNVAVNIAGWIGEPGTPVRRQEHSHG